MSRIDSSGSSRARLPWPLLAIFLIFAAAPFASAAEQGTEAKSREGKRVQARSKEAKSDEAKSKEAKSPDAEIRATADAFIKAFNAGDAKAVAALWTPAGTMADDRGEIFKGRKAIEDQYAAFFKAFPGAKMVIAIKSIDFPAASMAVEDGMAQVFTRQPGPPVASRYTAIHVRENGKWQMASVRETTVPLTSNFSKLEELGWLIGTWQTKRDGTAVRATFRWIANKSFIERDFTVSQDGIQTASGIQVIGWDPQAGRFRSWSFDASGGYGTSLWTPTPEGMHAESSGVMPDGTPTSSEKVLIRVPGEDNVFGWRSFHRSIGDVALPDTAEVVLDRVPEKK
jgi:uncharacterized protein (TIGR02246 family)